MAQSAPDHPTIKAYFRTADGKIISRFWDEESESYLINHELKLAPYIASNELVELVRLAQILQRPILIKGEPGSGKTQLAKSVAYEWYGKDYKKHYFEWHIKSTSKAKEGIYTFDHVGRLRTAQLDKSFDIEKEDKTRFRQFGEMAKAFQHSTKENPSILLIDEIDKADVDFPNDLLLELDENRFVIPETGESIEAEHPPLIFITSNSEREMPQAFLRRCLFVWLDFPQGNTLRDIVFAHLPNLAESHAGFVDKAVELFNVVRSNLDNMPAESKNVSTGELLNWLKGFEWIATTQNKSEQELISMLEDKENGLRFYPALFKTYLSYTQRKQLAEQKQ